MSRLARLARTSLGNKLWMSLSGLTLFSFLTGHPGGSLKALECADALNDYAAWLQGRLNFTGHAAPRVTGRKAHGDAQHVRRRIQS